MASLQEPGQVEVYLRKPSGQVRRVYAADVAMAAPNGGSPDGLLTSVATPEKREFVPVQPGVLEVDDFLDVRFIPAGADGIDVSDCIWIIVMQQADGGTFSLSRSDFANPTPTDYVTVANIPVTVGAWKADRRCRFGGGKTYIDIQDDTA